MYDPSFYALKANKEHVKILCATAQTTTDEKYYVSHTVCHQLYSIFVD